MSGRFAVALRIARDWRVWVGLLLPIAAIAFTLRGVDLRQVAAHIGDANPWLVLAMVPLHVLALYLRALRWRWLARSLSEHPLPIRPLFRATALGFMAINVLPLRLGELARPWLLGRETEVRGSAALGTLVLERASPASKGKVFLLASEPAQGECSDGDPPRRIVLHTIDGTSVSTKPVIELPCGTDAIAVHLTAEAGRARMWWTEPVDAKTCNQAGLPIAAVVTASSDGPAKRTGILAEGVAQIDGSRFVAVVRAGGCSPYAQPGNGALQMLK